MCSISCEMWHGRAGKNGCDRRMRGQSQGGTRRGWSLSKSVGGGTDQGDGPLETCAGDSSWFSQSMVII